jgi:hydroxyethylthiazole kinase-like uncharacterized protein yjeF
MAGEEATARFVTAMLGRCDGVAVVLDALAMSALPERKAGGPCVLATPHAGEMAHLTGQSKDAITADPERHARDAAARWNAVVVLKGARTIIAAPDGRSWCHEGGNAGLATSGSGDTLAGLITGLAARGAPLEQAAAWGVRLHSRAGEVLAGRQGPLGYLARELPAEFPALMHAIARAPSPESEGAR